MKSCQLKFLNNENENVIQIVSSHLKGFKRVSTKYTELFLVDINKIRIASTMMIVVFLKTEDFKTYELHIFSGGGKKDNVIKKGFGAEISELKRFQKILKESLLEKGFIFMKPNQDYYGLPYF